jgi:hypothetical protein
MDIRHGRTSLRAVANGPWLVLHRAGSLGESLRKTVSAGKDMISASEKDRAVEVGGEPAKRKSLKRAPSQLTDQFNQRGKAASRDQIDIARETVEAGPIEWLGVQISRTSAIEGLAA